MLIDWFTVFAQTVNFLILVWLMKRTLYQPILKAIDAREARIAAQLKDAEAKQTAAARERDDFQQKNASFEQRRDAMFKAALNDAKAEKERLQEEARKDADALRAKLESAVQGERDALTLAVTAGVQREVFSIARRALADLAAVGIETQICQVFIDRLRALDAPAKTELAAALNTLTEPALVRSAFELPTPQRESILQALKSAFGVGIAATFETAPRLVCGIELSAGGHKLAWSIDDYLNSLGKRMEALLAPPARPVDAKEEVKAASAAKVTPIDAAAATPDIAASPGP